MCLRVTLKRLIIVCSVHIYCDSLVLSSEEPRRQRWNNPPPQPQPRAGPENFRSNFPSLEEHEKMTKKEREELQQRQVEEAERSEQRRERSHSPYHDFQHMPDGPWRGGPQQGYPPHPSRRGGQGPMRGNRSNYRMGECSMKCIAAAAYTGIDTL